MREQIEILEHQAETQPVFPDFLLAASQKRHPVNDTSLARVIAVYEVMWMGQSFIKSDGLIWPMFYEKAKITAVNRPMAGRPNSSAIAVPPSAMNRLSRAALAKALIVNTC